MKCLSDAGSAGRNSGALACVTVGWTGAARVGAEEVTARTHERLAPNMVVTASMTPLVVMCAHCTASALVYSAARASASTPASLYWMTALDGVTVGV
jgi:hypothetical protein